MLTIYSIIRKRLKIELVNPDDTALIKYAGRFQTK